MKELPGKIVSGAYDVFIENQKAARKTDYQDHGGSFCEGSADVLINNASFLAARAGDRFHCTEMTPDGKPHVGGFIITGAALVIIGGRPAARVTDATLCTASAADLGPMPGAGNVVTFDANADCAALWAKYTQQTEDLLKPVDGDARARNRVISGAYADLFLADPSMRWAGLAAYASKQVGCAMDFASSMPDRMKAAASPSAAARAADPGAAAMVDAAAAAAAAAAAPAAKYSYDKLGDGNRSLFMDVYPTHLFFKNHGYAKLAACAAARVPPLTATALDAFRAADEFKKTGDKEMLNKSVEALAWHEQLGPLQNDVYNDPLFKGMLRANEMGLPVVNDPASVVMGRNCQAAPGDKTMRFAGTNADGSPRNELYNVKERMDWILNDIGKEYAGMDPAKHRSDLDGIRTDGARAGGKY